MEGKPKVAVIGAGRMGATMVGTLRRALGFARGGAEARAA